MVLEETLRKYPPAWIGPRRAIEAFEFEGHTVPGARVRQLLLVGVAPPARRVRASPRSSAPSASRPRPARRCRKGAYVPFGGGSRTCIGMRFGQLEVRTIATLILSRCTLSLPRGLPAEHPPDADDQPQAGPADARRCRGAPSSTAAELAAAACLSRTQRRLALIVRR